jgi:hypothetical protein
MLKLSDRDRAVMRIIIYAIIFIWVMANTLIVGMLWAHHKDIRPLTNNNLSLLLIFGITINIIFGEIFYRSGKEKYPDGKDNESNKSGDK